MPHIHELYDFTASAFVLHPTDPKVLLLKHIKIGKWLQPGGHVELDEDPVHAMWRELEEEAGLLQKNCEIIEPADQPQVRHDTPAEVTLPLPFHLNLHTFKEGEPHQHIDICFLVKAQTDKLTEHPEGAEAINWFTIGEIRKLHESGEVFDATLDICEWVFANKF